MKTLTAVLFAGGESRRMGADKATLQWQGETLWSRHLRTLRELAPQKIFISARTRPLWCPPDVQTILDEPPSRGPLSGLAAALGQIETTHLLALAVDLPRVNAELLRGLWRLAQLGAGVVPKREGYFEPLCAIYPVAAAAQAVAALQKDRLAVQDFVRGLIAENLLQTMGASDPDFFLNVNSPDLLR